MVAGFCCSRVFAGEPTKCSITSVHSRGGPSIAFARWSAPDIDNRPLGLVEDVAADNSAIEPIRSTDRPLDAAGAFPCCPNIIVDG
jgi:hypothetical protein